MNEVTYPCPAWLVPAGPIATAVFYGPALRWLVGHAGVFRAADQPTLGVMWRLAACNGVELRLEQVHLAHGDLHRVATTTTWQGAVFELIRRPTAVAFRSGGARIAIIETADERTHAPTAEGVH